METKVEVIVDRVGTFCRNGVLNSLAECVDVSINRVLADCKNITGQVPIIDLEVGFEQAEFLNPPASVNYLNASSSLTGGTLVTLRAAKPLSEFGASEDPVGKAIEKSIDVSLGKICRHGWSQDGSR
jgi:hypothetical protein